MPVLLLIAWVAFANVVTGFLFWWDKRSARLQNRRVPESKLLLWSALGGWPAAIVVGRTIRHKTMKGSFRWRFFAVIAFNLAAMTGLIFGLARL